MFEHKENQIRRALFIFLVALLRVLFAVLFLIDGFACLMVLLRVLFVVDALFACLCCKGQANAAREGDLLHCLV